MGSFKYQNIQKQNVKKRSNFTSMQNTKFCIFITYFSHLNLLIGIKEVLYKNFWGLFIVIQPFCIFHFPRNILFLSDIVALRVIWRAVLLLLLLTVLLRLLTYTGQGNVTINLTNPSI